MSEPKIGQWAKRKGALTRHVEPDGTEWWSGPRWHLVESIVAEDVVTRCGKRMDRVASRGELQVSEVMPLTRMIGQPQLCKAGCEGAVTRAIEDQRANGMPEDDLSTAPVDALDVPS